MPKKFPKTKVKVTTKSYTKSKTNRRGKTKVKSVFTEKSKSSNKNTKAKSRTAIITKNKRQKLIDVFTHKDKKTGKRYTTYKGKLHRGKKAKRVYKRVVKKIKRKTKDMPKLKAR